LRTISLNCSTFKTTRDLSQIKYFLRQAFPYKADQILNVYKEATVEPYNYLLLNFKLTVHDGERIRSNIFPSEVNYIYK